MHMSLLIENDWRYAIASEPKIEDERLSKLGGGGPRVDGLKTGEQKRGSNVTKRMKKRKRREEGDGKACAVASKPLSTQLDATDRVQTNYALRRPEHQERVWGDFHCSS